MLVLEKSPEASAPVTPLTLDVERVSIVTTPFSGTSFPKCCGRPCTDDDDDGNAVKVSPVSRLDGNRPLEQYMAREVELLVEPLAQVSPFLGVGDPPRCEIDDGDGLQLTGSANGDFVEGRVTRTVDDPGQGNSMPNHAIGSFDTQHGEDGVDDKAAAMPMCATVEFGGSEQADNGQIPPARV